MTHRRRFLRLCGVTGIGAIAGCSDVGDDNGSITDEQSTSTATVSPTQTESAPHPYTQQTKLTATDGESFDQFGFSTAVSSGGSTAVIGAADDDNSNGDAAGSAYIFDNADGSWTQQAKLTATDGENNDQFGYAVAISDDGTTTLIGARATPGGDSAGSAYIFNGSGESWTQDAKLTANDQQSSDQFGQSVAVSGDATSVLIGAPGVDESAYVFTQTDESWRQQAKLTSNDGERNDAFAFDLAMSTDGSTAFIGAYADNNSNGESAGSVYVFDNSEDSWTQQTNLTANDGDSNDRFATVAVSGDGTTALIGALNDADPNGSESDDFTGAGSAYVFENTDGMWSQQAKLAAEDGDSRDLFGFSVSLSDDGSTALIGADNDEDPYGYNEEPFVGGGGSTYVFNGSDGSWTQQTKLVADDGDSSDHFGISVSLSGDGSTSLIGAYKDEDPNGEEAGSAYLFT